MDELRQFEIEAFAFAAGDAAGFLLPNLQILDADLFIWQIGVFKLFKCNHGLPIWTLAEGLYLKRILFSFTGRIVLRVCINLGIQLRSLADFLEGVGDLNLRIEDESQAAVRVELLHMSLTVSQLEPIGHQADFIVVSSADLDAVVTKYR